MSKLDDAVSEGETGWDFVCPGFDGDPCGPWASRGWPTKKTATERGREHFASHTDKVPTSSLDDFREKHGVQLNDDGSVTA